MRMLATCPNFVISVENAFLVNVKILGHKIINVNSRNRFSVYLFAPSFLIEQRVYGANIVDHHEEPAMWSDVLEAITTKRPTGGGAS